ncbi:elongation factor G [Gottschalkia purinilytica]|uniref:Elongation factor G n=1 Tax=Gottschalkia purinilytica TaxID=1503 RepID=A0A0L0W9K4_GOTPU|nr:elongation factor G [Gottschalkia purinilytica]KNF07980.1 elongation factor G [Gottschalkia purinilytica]
MQTYHTSQIRNVVLLGHGSCGKTTLGESILYATKTITRKGKVEEKNTISDFNKEEMNRQFSISTSILPVEWKNIKINMLDTPGYFDFYGEVESALKICESAVIVVDASSGIEVGTEKAWKLTEKEEKPKIIFINKLDKENINLNKLIDNLRDKLGLKIVPVTIPTGKEDSFKGFVDIINMVGKRYNGEYCEDVPISDEVQEEVNKYRDILIESIAETDENLLEKFFNEEEFTEEEIRDGLKKAILNNNLVPVVMGSAINDIGVHTLLNMIDNYLPSPEDITLSNIEINNQDPFSAFVFKTISDPFVGKISLFKVCTGKISKDKEIYNANKESAEKLSNIFIMRGKNHIEVNEIIAGDIGATTKLQITGTGDTLCDKKRIIKYEKVNYPQPCLFLAIEPRSKGDEEKIGISLQKIVDEDPTFTVERNKETKELLIGGQGNIQLDIAVSKLKNTFGVDVDLKDPKIPYRETIKGKSDVQGKHKKQTGGAGQYGDVHIRFEPSENEFEFQEEIFGGAVPRQYIPAVEKGLRESLEKGVLAGFPVVNVRAILYDGSYHSVDSNEMAFKIAASLAFKKGIKEANPVLLEPIMKIEILIPEEYMGEIMGDMNKRRGKILGMEQKEDGSQLVIAEAPHSEILKYATDLRSMTQARGTFTMEFLRYEEVPHHMSEKIIEEFQ